jgi:cyclic pyranopterin phosphate synthase
LNYLRISITDRCNLRCVYCQPEGLRGKLRHTEILSYEEILRIARVAIELGISKIRITGGEPLVRKGVYDFLAELSRLDGLSDISLTTNGVFLKENIDRIRTAGIRRVNISLDTLNRQKYLNITGHDRFDKVWDGIRAAHENGFHPIKLNAVALKGFNEDELIAFARLTFTHPYHVRFIECMPMGDPHLDAFSALLTPEIKACVSRLGRMTPVAQQTDDGPAERYRFEGANGEIGFISALSRHFCKTCNRLRLTASGQLRVCLLSDRQFDIKGPLRKGCSDRELAAIFLKAVQAKPSRHGLNEGKGSAVESQMSSIGG